MRGSMHVTSALRSSTGVPRLREGRCDPDEILAHDYSSRLEFHGSQRADVIRAPLLVLGQSMPGVGTHGLE